MRLEESGAVSALQYALFDEDFNLSELEIAFALEYVANGENGQAAILSVFPNLTPGSARGKAYLWLKKSKKNERRSVELRRYMDWRKAKLAFRAELNEDELVEKSRRVYLHGVGEMRLQKSMVSRDEDGGVTVQDVAIFEPSLAAANSAVEQLRKLGGFGVEKTAVAVSGRLSGMSDEEREKRLRELAMKAGLLVDESDGAGK